MNTIIKTKNNVLILSTSRLWLVCALEGSFFTRGPFKKTVYDPRAWTSNRFRYYRNTHEHWCVNCFFKIVKWWKTRDVPCTDDLLLFKKCINLISTKFVCRDIYYRILAVQYLCVYTQNTVKILLFFKTLFFLILIILSPNTKIRYYYCYVHAARFTFCTH